MPKTRLQGFIFSLMMAFAMVYTMEVYNMALRNGGLENFIFLAVFKELIFMLPLCMLVQHFIGMPLAKRLASRIVDPTTDKPIFITLATSAMTVCIMAPTMSLCATLIFNGIHADFIARWIETFVKNFPMALCWQIFFAGPLVRNLFAFAQRKVCVQSVTV